MRQIAAGANWLVDREPVTPFDHCRHDVLVAQRRSQPQYRGLDGVGVGAAARQRTEQSNRDTTAPGRLDNARMVAIAAGDRDLTTPSTMTHVPRISSTWPATRTVRACSSGSSSVMCRASAPNRIRSGDDVGTPSRTSGRAVTGPTHIACTSVRIADNTASAIPSSVARMSTDATAGADVKLTASKRRSAMPVTS